MDFGPANFPAVINSTSPTECRCFVIGPPGKMAIEFLYADVPNSDCDSKTDNFNCLVVVQSHKTDEIHSSSQIQKISVHRSSAMVVLFVNQPLGFRGFHARFIEDDDFA